VSERTVYRHKRRGAIYEVLHDNACLECSAAPEFEKMFDEDHFVVYRSIHSAAVYVRPYPEFHDGRFEAIPDPRDSSI
jgi:hypothetical protein